MKLLVRYITIIATLLSAFAAMASDGAQMSLKFKRFLHEHIVDFTDDRTIVLEAKVINLVPKKKYQLTLKYGFINEKSRTKKFTQRANKRGEFAFDKSMSLMRFYRKNKGAAKIFNAQVHIEGAMPNGAFAHKTIDLLVMPNSGDPIYRVVSGPLCQWQGETRLDSEYYFNETGLEKGLTIKTEMQLTRGFNLEFSTEGGPNASLTNLLSDLLKLPSATPATTTTTTSPTVNPNPTSAQAFGPSTSSFFVGATYGVRLEKRQTFEFTRNWTLQVGQGGYLFRRNTFTRYKAVRFEKRAGIYVPGAIGTFDIGRDAQDFGIVPLSMQGRFEEGIKFIEKTVPRLNSCAGQDNNTYPSIQIANEELQIMFLKEGDLK